MLVLIVDVIALILGVLFVILIGAILLDGTFGWSFGGVIQLIGMILCVMVAAILVVIPIVITTVGVCLMVMG